MTATSAMNELKSHSPIDLKLGASSMFEQAVVDYINLVVSSRCTDWQLYDDQFLDPYFW